jgi:inner membrane protein
MLTGACLSRAFGFPARARYATAACVIAAELPDIDYVYRLGGPLTYFQHHRGWTHSLWALPLEALAVVGLFWAMHRTRHIWKKHRSVDEPAKANWTLLWLMALLALCSHIALDWTNNYGVRPFAPLYPQWFAGELFFIVEPVLLAALAAALLLPLIFSLVHSEIGIRRPRYEGRWLAAAALLVLAGLLGQRGMAHADADSLLRAQMQNETILDTSENPHPMNADTWHGVVDTPGFYQTGSINLALKTFESDTSKIELKKPDTPVITAAKKSWLGHVYLDWSKFPQVTDLGTAETVHPEMLAQLSAADGADHVVRFTDLRFKYDTFLMHGATGPSPISGEVWIDSSMKVRRIYFGAIRQSLP